MNKIIILPIAKSDIRHAAKWYDKIKKGLGGKFIKEIEHSISIIQDNPLSFAKKYDDVRTLLISKFPYSIHYKLERENTIVIKAVFHSSRNPMVWKDEN